MDKLFYGLKIVGIIWAIIDLCFMVIYLFKPSSSESKDFGIFFSFLLYDVIFFFAVGFVEYAFSI